MGYPDEHRLLEFGGSRIYKRCNKRCNCERHWIIL